MHDPPARFASVPLALAAYNAGPARRAGACTPYPEPQAYVANKIVGLLGGAGDASTAAAMEVRLVK